MIKCLMSVQKVPNDGKHLSQINRVVTFLTCKGWRTPMKYGQAFRTMELK